MSFDDYHRNILFIQNSQQPSRRTIFRISASKPCSLNLLQTLNAPTSQATIPYEDDYALSPSSWSNEKLDLIAKKLN